MSADTLSNGSFLALQWRSYWDPVLAGNSEEQIARFEPWIAKAATEIYDAASGMFAIRIALASALVKLNPTPNNARRADQASSSNKNFLRSIEEYHDVDVAEEEFATQLQQNIARPKRALMLALQWLSRGLPARSAMIKQILDVVQDFGRLEYRINFSQMLWYDIIDSTGQKSGLSGGELFAYRARVRAFKDAINGDFYGLTREASRQKGIVHGWQGNVFAKDDEKHLFFTGTRSLSWLREAIKILFTRCAAHGLRVRAIALPADFAGVPAYRYRNDPTVDGEQFWEHLSRVKKQLREFEKGNHASYLWKGGKLIKTLELDRTVRWEKPFEFKTKTVIEEFELTTRFIGGQLEKPRNS